MGLPTAACAEGSSTTAPDSPAGNASQTKNGDPAPATTSRGKPRLKQIANFSQPVEIKSAPGYKNLMFVVEQEGRVMVLRKGRKLKKPFLNIKGRVESGGERGLLSVGFPPDYKKSKRFYVYYTDSTGDIRVVEFKRRSAVRAKANSARNVITIPHREHANHNGGQLQFRGSDLYFATGDGGGGGDEAGNAQNLNVLLGKMIRINPKPKNGKPYTIPSSNPFVGRTGRNEIYSYGLRNPFRWSFQQSGGKTRMVIADVGQNEFEEINTITIGRASGANYGWNRFEGFSEFDGAIDDTVKPAIVLPHPPNCSVIGGLVVRDRKVPALFGRYLFTDFCNSEIRSFKLRNGRVRSKATGISENSISSFAANAARKVFMTSLNGGVFRLVQ
ncbi:MAG: PQQ-dependent sugar dehydrogenase [Solirubrobacterales bacterium]